EPARRVAAGVVEHAERTDVDQAMRPGGKAGVDDVARAPGRARFEIAQAAAHRRADVINGAHAVDGVRNDSRIAQVADDHLDAWIGVVSGKRLSHQHPYVLSLGAQAPDQGTADETGSAC